MNKICFINGSPRGKNSGSQYFGAEIHNLLGEGFQMEDICIVECQKNHTEAEAFATILNADCLVFLFPLYIDSIPSHMMDFLYRLETHVSTARGVLAGRANPLRVYAVVNNGFIEGAQNRNALRIMRHFTEAAGLQWRFGIGIGAGEFMRETQKVISLQAKMKRQVYEALVKLTEDIAEESVSLEKDRFASPAIPKLLFMIVGKRNWIAQARENKLKRKQLYARP